ncbi:hypothetical protein DY000_02046201 [Brassica cretica]|uniref:F-box associated domain-containing protein n=1 Tax=Brassica cretica TaxID=69181 RepID=A0ABQ7F252_BRACR|nr:hypothetical protein DY000_02046201 [Brassica cretica]
MLDESGLRSNLLSGSRKRYTASSHRSRRRVASVMESGRDMCLGGHSPFSYSSGLRRTQLRRRAQIPNGGRVFIGWVFETCVTWIPATKMDHLWAWKVSSLSLYQWKRLSSLWRTRFEADHSQCRDISFTRHISLFFAVAGSSLIVVDAKTSTRLLAGQDLHSYPRAPAAVYLVVKYHVGKGQSGQKGTRMFDWVA